ncbi:hypothetical protein EY643_11435 [Halioglobus maricola]|uniref:Uncharacterized protein n=2 Tax=Halioglobus maricola TaxID=2601894 RepID=A0A5P9NK33_9GAMM|nr:hypothetical protein EY643_11435 [Halioglobus maricola]
MYRYSVDNAVTYTSEDLVLFRESPFACWMERLHLENPDHGIPPDSGSAEPGDTMTRQDDIAESLRGEGKQVALIDWDAPEALRRGEALQAMRQGVDFIVNGQLALGPLSGSANLLMRTSGYSELGNYLYIPCDTQGKTTIHSAFRLCFLADLLHGLQGQLPPQMLVIRGGDLLPLKTDDHIYHYRAVKQRFMSAMRDFRKHRMPDPAESSHFGRWSDCANEVLRQRAERDDIGEQLVAPEVEEAIADAVAAEQADAAEESLDVRFQNPIQARLATGRGLKVSGTLADQARALQVEVVPTAYEAAPQAPAVAPDAALDNLSFIGSGDLTSLPTDSGAFDVDCIDDSDYALPESDAAAAPVPRPFSSSLHTGDDDFER